MKLERLIVIGAGAVGGGIGGLLSEAGLPTELVARGEHGRKIRKDGVEIQMPDQQLTANPNCVESRHFSLNATIFQTPPSLLRW